MNPILLNLLLGFVGMPLVLFLLASGLRIWRDRRGMQPLPPDKVSLLVILLSLASWIIAGANIVVLLIKGA